ncbi:MAG: FAD binding domain-containing protein [Planctomycetes bacterium]|nr:FAD binding domain-containing protein [Planctomycetota bacterium]
MKPFSYARPASREEAVRLLSPTARPKGGGYDLLDLAKNGVSTPGTMVSLAAVPEMGKAWTGDHGETYLGGRMTLADLATLPAVRAACPVVADAAAEAATPLVRATATLAGNLLQRPRCTYFRDPFFECRKRGGAACPAMEGDHAEGAILGNRLCCAVHPSNLAAALLAAGAELRILTGVDGKGEPTWRTAAVDPAFFVAPEEDPLREARIGPGELVFDAVVPPCPSSAYVEVNQKASFDWASAAAAVVLEMDGGKVARARVALGAAAPVPLLSEAAAAALAGKAPGAKAAEAAAEAAVAGATPLRDNAHRVQHLRVCVKRAVLLAAGRGR